MKLRLPRKRKKAIKKNGGIFLAMEAQRFGWKERTKREGLFEGNDGSFYPIYLGEKGMEEFTKAIEGLSND